MRHYLSVCAIFKDEGRYLREWIAFHRLVGVEHFYLYDNGSTDDSRQAVAEAAPAAAITLLDWPPHPGQIPAYDHCLRHHGRDSRWLAFLDIDEFMFSPEVDDFRVLLRDYEAHPGLAMTWVEFGASGHRIPPPGYVTHNYLRRARAGFTIAFPQMLRRPGLDPAVLANYYPQSAHVKMAIDPSRALRCLNAHRFEFAGGAPAVTETGLPMRTNWSDQPSITRTRINHYWSKSLAEFEAKLARGRSDIVEPYDPDFAHRKLAHLDAVADDTILALARRLP